MGSCFSCFPSDDHCSIKDSYIYSCDQHQNPRFYKPNTVCQYNDYDCVRYPPLYNPPPPYNPSY